MSEAVFERIRDEIRKHPVLIYMKGTPTAPQCGFSAETVRIFQDLGVPIETRDVLADAERREAIKRFSNWPTIPQVYVGGEFVGGCDIVRELHASGELQSQVRRALDS